MRDPKELIEIHGQLVKRRGDIITMRSNLHIELIQVDLDLEKLHQEIFATMAKLESEHIDIELPPKF